MFNRITKLREMSKAPKTEKNNAPPPSSNPEKNSMQGNFLDDEFCLKFYQLAFPRELVDSLTRSYEVVINKRNICVDLENPTGEKYISDKNFGKNNIDVSYSVAIDFERVEAWDVESNRTINTNDSFDTIFFTKELRIEIQPNVSDDYPIILRYMQKIKSNCLYLREYSGKGLDEQKFVQMFNHQDIIVVFERKLNEK